MRENEGIYTAAGCSMQADNFMGTDINIFQEATNK